MKQENLLYGPLNIKHKSTYLSFYIHSLYYYCYKYSQQSTYIVRKLKQV